MKQIFNGRMFSTNNSQIRGAHCTCSLHEKEDRWMADLSLWTGPMRKEKQTVAALHHRISPMCLDLETQYKALIHGLEEINQVRHILAPSIMEPLLLTAVVIKVQWHVLLLGLPPIH